MDLSDGYSLHDHHASAAFGTRPKRARVLEGGWFWSSLGRSGVERGEAQREKLNSAPMGEEAKMANANEAFWKQMQEEAAQKLIE